MYSDKDILTRAWLVREVVNSVLLEEGLKVEKILLIGSYASGKQNAWSDLDFLIQLTGGKFIGTITPDWKKIQEIYKKLDSPKIHIVFGTEESAKSLHEKNKHNPKNYSYRELNLREIENVSNSRSTSN